MHSSPFPEDALAPIESTPAEPAHPRMETAGAADEDYYRRQLETVAENATLALFIMDERQRCTYMNRAAEEMTGFCSDELEGKELHYYIHHTRPDGSHYPLEECPIDQAFPQNMREQGEEVFVHKDGQLYPVTFTASPIRRDGLTVGTIIEARDITEERAREAELAREQERYRFFAEMIPAQAWTARSDGRLDYVSDRTARYFGVPAAQVLEDGWLEVLHPGDVAKAADRWGRSITTGASYEVEFRLRRADGEYRWHLARADAMRSPTGEITAWFGVNTDIHDQKVAEAERERLVRDLETGQARLSQIFAEAPAVMALYTGPDHVITMVNPAWARTVGKPEVLGKTFRDAFPEFAQSGLYELLDQVYETGDPFVESELNVPLERFESGVLEDSYWNFVWRPLAGEGPRGRDILVHAVEVTDQVLARRQVEEKAVELARIARVLEASNRELDQFAYVASHDLKAPLRGISNISTWIEDDLPDGVTPVVKEHLELLRGRVQRMDGLIDGILQYSRAGRVREPAVRVDTAELVQYVVELIAPPEQVQIRLDERLPSLWTERLPLQQVFMNLIGNAVKYARAGEPLVEVSARHVNGEWEFAVRDNGPGIAPEYHERVFGIFQMLEARDKVEGTGIGLSIVKKLVESRGGRVWVESEEGAGSTFRFLWPVIHEENPGNE